MGDRLAGWFESVAARLFGPVFALEATRVGRRTSTFIIRWVYLLVLVGVLGGFFFSQWEDVVYAYERASSSALANFAERFFWWYVVTQFLGVCLLTPALTAAAITDEKERKTLDFLLVTDLTGREIVFGKLAVRVGLLIMLVLAGLPVIALMQLFGGIEPQLLFLTLGMTLVTVLSLSALSVAASVLMSRSRDAVILAYALPAAYLYVSSQLPDPALVARGEGAIEVFRAGDPVRIAREIGRGSDWSGVPNSALPYLVFHGIVAVFGFSLAGFRLRKSVGGRSTPVVKPRGILGRLFVWAIDRRTEARPHPPVGDDPVLWREMYVDPGSRGGLLRRLLMIGLVAAIFWQYLGLYDEALNHDRTYFRNSAWRQFQKEVRLWVCIVTGVLGSLMLLGAAIRGAASVAGERDRDTWVSLKTTRLTAGEILYGKWAGCVWSPRGMMYLLAVVWAVGLVTFSVKPLLLLPVAALLGVYLYAFAWLGIRISVRARNTRVAIARAVTSAIFLGGGLSFILGGCLLGLGLRGEEASNPLLGLLTGFTPPLMLAGFPALEFDFFDLFATDESIFGFLLIGGTLGTVGWITLGHLCRAGAHRFSRG